MTASPRVGEQPVNNLRPRTALAPSPVITPGVRGVPGHGLGVRFQGLAPAGGRGDYGHTPQTESLRTALEASIRINEALGGWADWATRPAAPQEADR